MKDQILKTAGIIYVLLLLVIMLAFIIMPEVTPQDSVAERIKFESMIQ